VGRSRRAGLNGNLVDTGLRRPGPQPATFAIGPAEHPVHGGTLGGHGVLVGDDDRAFHLQWFVGQERQRKAPELAAQQPGSAWVPLREDPARTSCAGKRGSPGVKHGIPQPREHRHVQEDRPGVL
jgi:hypothetical protein